MANIKFHLYNTFYKATQIQEYSAIPYVDCFLAMGRRPSAGPFFQDMCKPFAFLCPVGSGPDRSEICWADFTMFLMFEAMKMDGEATLIW